jgi:outer membrane protein TolC
VELYGIKERINQLYFGILYLDEQVKQVVLVENDINAGIKTVGAQVSNGVALRSNLNLLKAELLTTAQRGIELKASRKGFVDALAQFLGQPLNDDVVLELPPSAIVAPTADIQRPELKLFENQSNLYDQQNRLIRSKLLPKASLFAQGGVGKPGLNLLDNQFKFYYIGGLRLNWSLSALYTQKKEAELAKISQQTVDVQKETFLLNTNVQLKQQQAEIDKLRQLVATDDDIIELRKTVTDAAKAQLENGVITANDYLKQVDAEDQARQAQITHRVQLLQSQINYQTISGK